MAKRGVVISDGGEFNLFHAAKNDCHTIVKELYFAGIDLNVTDDKGKTALFYANQKHSMHTLCRLLDYGAKFKLDEIDGKVVLFHAAKNDYHQTVGVLHFAGLNLNITDDKGKTAVFYANQNHSIDTLCRLLDYGAEFMLDEIHGKAVLFHAAKNNYDLTVWELHVAGIDLDLTDDEGKTAVFHANHNDSMDVLCALIGCGAKFTLNEIDGKAVLFHAAKSTSFLCEKIVKPLFEAGLDIDITDDKNKTAVFYANLAPNMDALCELISCGAEFKLDEINGYDVLVYAAENEYEEVVKPLQKSGLDLNKTVKHGKTAAFYGDKDFLDALMEVDEISIDARDSYGRTPLFYAIRRFNTTKARHLIEKGANLQLKDNCSVGIFTFFVENRIRMP